MSVEYFYKLPHILSKSVKLIVDQCHIYSPLASVPAATLQSHHRQQRSLGRGCHKLRNSNAFTLGLGPEVPPPLHLGQLQGVLFSSGGGGEGEGSVRNTVAMQCGNALEWTWQRRRLIFCPGLTSRPPRPPSIMPYSGSYEKRIRFTTEHLSIERRE